MLNFISIFFLLQFDKTLLEIQNIPNERHYYYFTLSITFYI